MIAFAYGMDEVLIIMDNPMIRPIREGFKGQRLTRLPRTVLDESARHPLLCGLRVTDAGFFPTARGHTIHREQGAETTLLIHCTHGAGWINLESQETRSVRPHDFVWLPAYRGYAYGASPEAPWTILWAHIEGPETEAWRQHLALSERGGIRQMSEATSAIVARLMDEAGRSLEKGYTQTDQVIAASSIRAALSYVAETPASPASAQAEHRVSATISWMAGHLSLSPQLAELAALAAVSVPHYTATFRRLTGFSPINYHTRLRIQRASVLLETTEASIIEIAHDLGFDDAFYFSRLFRQIVGHSPRHYRNAKKAPVASAPVPAEHPRQKVRG